LLIYRHCLFLTAMLCLDEKSSSASGYAAGSRPVPPTPARPLPQPGAKQVRNTN